MHLLAPDRVGRHHPVSHRPFQATALTGKANHSLFDGRLAPQLIVGKTSAQPPKSGKVLIERQIDLLRVSKSKAELTKIKKAIKIAETAFEQTLPLLKPGVKEIEWALDLECAMRRAGSGPLPFDVIVASGVRGAMPHAKASSKPVRKGELVTVDFGASFDGYNCDTTVTVALGNPGKEIEEIYQVVLEAHDMAIESAEVGMELRDFSTAEANGQRFFAVTVRTRGGRGELDLIGSAIVRDDPWRAAACATLDAVNRRLSSLAP